MDYHGLAFPLNTLGMTVGSTKVWLMISLAYSFPAMSSKLILSLLVRMHSITIITRACTYFLAGALALGGTCETTPQKCWAQPKTVCLSPPTGKQLWLFCSHPLVSVAVWCLFLLLSSLRSLLYLFYLMWPLIKLVLLSHSLSLLQKTQLSLASSF